MKVDVSSNSSNSSKRKSVFVTRDGISWQTKSEVEEWVGDELDRINDQLREASELDKEEVCDNQPVEWDQAIDELSDDDFFNRFIDHDDFLREVHEDDSFLARK